jgi:peptidoglycan hydrolase CwlO-like protein
MGEVQTATLEQRIEELEKELKGLNAALEVRLRGIWKGDITAAYRGVVNDIVARSKEHTEIDVRNHLNKADVGGRLSEQDRKVSERLSKHDALVYERIAKSREQLENLVVSLVVRTLAEYKVTSGLDNQPIKAE